MNNVIGKVFQELWVPCWIEKGRDHLKALTSQALGI